jgi:integrase
LVAHFGEAACALDMTSNRVAAYVDARQKQGAANATINRETAALRRMFHVPMRPCLEEAPPRRGFLEPAEFARLRDALVDDLKDPASFLYIVGWRRNGMRTLEWVRDLDLQFDANGKIAGGTVTLRAENAKNKRPLMLPLKGELLAIIRRAWDARRPECPFVFHRDGRKIRDFRKSWAKAHKAAGLDAVLVHDMRRSCARNLVRSGVPERVALAVTGHRTRSIFDRYNIVAESDLEAAMARVSDYVSAKAAEGPKVIPLPRRVA